MSDGLFASSIETIVLVGLILKNVCQNVFSLIHAFHLFLFLNMYFLVGVILSTQIQSQTVIAHVPVKQFLTNLASPY